MNIVVAGKGGSGKTTIAGMLARSLARQRGEVLALDGDSNPNLALTLGLSNNQEFRCPPASLLEQYTDANGKPRVRLAAPVRNVIDEYAVAGPDGVRLVVASRVGHAGAG